MFVRFFCVLSVARSLWPVVSTALLVRTRLLRFQLLDLSISCWRPGLVFPSCPLCVDLYENFLIDCLRFLCLQHKTKVSLI